MKNTLIIILLLFCANQVFAQRTLDDLLSTYNTRSIPYVSAEELRMLQVNSDVTILDAREEDEFKVSHIEGATFVGYNDFSIDAVSQNISEKDTPIIIYCSLGIRSEKIGEKLKKAGYTNVQNLYGGIFEWKNKTYPVLNNNNQQTDSIHTFSKVWSKWLDKGIKVYRVEDN